MAANNLSNPRHQKETAMFKDNEDHRDFAWFCLRSQLKHEQIAAAHLRQSNIDVFVPSIRFKRATRYGSVWVTEALFPSYLFARFDWTRSLRQVHYSPGVCEVVHFGCNWPVVPDQAIDELRSVCGVGEVHVIASEVLPGDCVQIVGGSFHGLKAVVSNVMPARHRVAVLLDFLGRQTAVEMEARQVIKETTSHRSDLLLNKSRSSVS